MVIPDASASRVHLHARTAFFIFAFSRRKSRKLQKYRAHDNTKHCGMAIGCCCWWWRWWRWLRILHEWWWWRGLGAPRGGRVQDDASYITLTVFRKAENGGLFTWVPLRNIWSPASCPPICDSGTSAVASKGYSKGVLTIVLNSTFFPRYPVNVEGSSIPNSPNRRITADTWWYLDACVLIALRLWSSFVFI